MNVVLSAAGVVFLAELGDKTQLVALGLGARHRLRSVVAGVIAAYIATTALSVVIGGLLGAALPTRVISIIGGLLFIGFALHTLREALGGIHDDQPGAETAQAPSGRSVVVTAALAMFVAELGDKTMIATATLAARDEALLVGVGALIGITAAGLIGVVVGRAVGARLPERAIGIGSAVLFAAFGVALLVSARS